MLQSGGQIRVCFSLFIWFWPCFDVVTLFGEGANIVSKLKNSWLCKSISQNGIKTVYHKRYSWNQLFGGCFFTVCLAFHNSFVEHECFRKKNLLNFFNNRVPFHFCQSKLQGTYPFLLIFFASNLSLGESWIRLFSICFGQNQILDRIKLNMKELI